MPLSKFVVLDLFETDEIMFMIFAAAARPLAIEPRFGAA